MRDETKKWLRAFRLKVTIVLAAVMILAMVFYAVAGEGFPESFWTTCGLVGAVLFVVWWWPPRP
ncbi:MAG: hypothetical protein ACYTG3_21000 [Planctomycetota bacterium]